LNFIVTGFSQNYWNPFGGSWLASLRLLAKTNSQLVVLDYGLSSQIVNILKKHDVLVKPVSLKDNFRMDSLRQISLLAKNTQDNFVYYDVDVWFQNNFDNLFEQFEHSLYATKNQNLGMVGGASKAWKKFEFVDKMTGFFRDPLLVEGLSYFKDYLMPLDNTYNWTALGNLVVENRIFKTDEQIPIAIHLTGNQKDVCFAKNTMFAQLYAEECKSFYNIPETVVGKIIAKPTFCYKTKSSKN